MVEAQHKINRHLGEMLVEAGVITDQDLQVALESQRHEPARLGKTLVQLGIALEKQILPILAQQLNRVNVTLDHRGVSKESSGSVADVLQELFVRAVEAGATDIHFEPTASEARVRVRIDGILRDLETPPMLKVQYPATVSRIKVLCNLDIAERRLPQEGRTTIQAKGKELDLRISILPTRFGEGVVVRILQTEIPLGLPNLGLGKKTLKSLEEILQRRSGLILVTGPTGCGKTTTLYACLSRLNDATRKIVTIEDPIEYTLGGAMQMQVNPSIGLTFDRMLKTVLRHDPNIIMVGEIRDKETAEVAIRMALTGHLVLSTLHTSDAASTITRLLEMGIEPYLVSSSLSCAIAQRLVRTICPDCKGKRCMSCLGLALKGRVGIFECLVVDDEVRKMILRRASVEEIREHATKKGMRTLYEDGTKKVEDGITKKEELDRIIHAEELL